MRLLFLKVWIFGSFAATALTLVGGAVTDSDAWGRAGTIASGSLGLSLAALTLCVFLELKTGGGLTHEPTARASPITRDIPSQIFRYRRRWLVSLPAFVLGGAGGLLMLAGTTYFGLKHGLSLGQGLAGLAMTALISLPFAFIGRRMVTARVILDGRGMDVKTIWSRAVIAWPEVVAFERFVMEVGYASTPYFRVATAERAVLIEDSLTDRERFVETVEGAAGTRLRHL